MAYDLTFTNKGVEIPSADSVKAELQQMFVDAFGSEINLDDSTPQGQLIVSLATIIMDKNNNLMQIINAFNPNTVKNDEVSGLAWQDALGMIYGLTRKEASKSSVNCVVSGVAGTVIPSNAQAISVNNDLFKISQETVIGDNGQANVVFYSVESGEIPVEANSINRIYTSVVGWDTINNPSSGILGGKAETRAEFERRRVEQLGRYSSSMLESVLASVEAVENVVDVVVAENDTDNNKQVQGVNLAPHSIYVCADGGNNQDIAKAIRNSKSGGCGTNGTTEVIDGYGVIKFDKVTADAVTVDVTVSKTSRTPADFEDKIKDALIASVDSLKIGESLYSGRLYYALGGIDINIVSLTVNDTSKVDFYLNQKASLDASSINIEVV